MALPTREDFTRLEKAIKDLGTRLDTLIRIQGAAHGHPDTEDAE